MKNKRALVPIVIVCLLFVFGFAYMSDVSRASDDALRCLSDTEEVRVVRGSDEVFLDGPGEEDALIFYPGGKVEFTAYAPLLHQIAAEGTDCFLVKMPLNLAILGKNRAEDVMREHDYQRWYLGGHSLGGAAASMFAADHSVDGLILLAAYPTSPVDERTLELYGSEDGVLNQEKRERGDAYLPEGSVVEVIPGGNHAQFGSYGSQRGDGEATISRAEQQALTVQKIREFIQKNP